MVRKIYHDMNRQKSLGVRLRAYYAPTGKGSAPPREPMGSYLCALIQLKERSGTSMRRECRTPPAAGQTPRPRDGSERGNGTRHTRLQTKNCF